MKRFLILFLAFIINCGSAFGLEIIYPKKNPATINANSSFFIGSTNPKDTLTINGDTIKIHKNGAFTYTVPLIEGDNEFKIISTPKNYSQSQTDNLNNNNNNNNSNENNPQNQPQTIDFIIKRPTKVSCSVKPATLINYPCAAIYTVTKNDAPLRSTPEDWGINRLSHLPYGMPLVINGEKGNFYRVVLGSKTIGWIMKSYVIKSKTITQLQPTSVKGFKKWEDSEFRYYYFILDRKSPYAIKETSNGLTLKLYDVELSENAGSFNIADNVLSYKIPINQKLFGYYAYYCGNDLALKVRKVPPVNIQKPLTGIKILVDAGHGGSEFGAIGPLGAKEKDTNLAISKDLEQELISRGATVVMTRANDCPVSLDNRVKMALNSDSLISISVHANAIPDGGNPETSRGTAVYYYNNQARPLAQSIQTSITSELGMKNNGTIQASFALVRPTDALSVLIETAYIINPEDYELLTNSTFQHSCAKAIADGVEHFLSGEYINLR